MSDEKLPSYGEFQSAFWVDAKGHHHLDVAKLCRVFKVEPTVENQQLAAGLAAEVFKRMLPGVEIRGTGCAADLRDPAVN